MIFSNKILLSAAVLVVATAASFPHEVGSLGTYPLDARKREALKICERNNPEFVRFFAGDRETCFNQMRGVGMPRTYSGVWSKPDRARM
jgi:hypothetical protein